MNRSQDSSLESIFVDMAAKREQLEWSIPGCPYSLINLHFTQPNCTLAHVMGVSLDNLGVSVFRHIGIRGCSEMPV